MEVNRIYNMDCLEGMKDIPDGAIDLILTDPPYLTTSRGNAGTSGGMLRTKLSMQGKVFEFNDILPSDYMGELYRVLKEQTHCYIMTNHVNLQETLNAATDAGFRFIKSLIWDKRNKINGQYYMSQFEYILFFRKGAAKRINNCGTSDMLVIPNIKTKKNGNNIHDTEKPVPLMQILIENSSSKGDLILDPFMGSGTSAIAAIKTGRNYMGYEIDPEYYSIALNRITTEESQQRLAF